MYQVHALLVLAFWLDLLMAGTAQSTTVVHELTSDFSWGYKAGVKQPLGAFQDGLSVYQISRALSPDAGTGNPDHLFWVDENTDSFGVVEHPTAAFLGNVFNPGGMVSFADDGTIWYAYGGRAPDLPIDLFSSQDPLDPTAFVRQVDDVDLASNSSTPLVHASDPNIMLFYRHGGSSNLWTTIRFQRYLNDDFSAPQIEFDIAHAEDHPQLGRIGIEQLWSRSDPRFDYTMLSWSFYDVNPVPDRLMGSFPLLYTDDEGATWRRVDGAQITDLPIRYSDIDDVMTPVDHLAEGRNLSWFVRDLGISPNGNFWMSMPFNQLGGELEFWFFDGAQWQERALANVAARKSHALGVTRDYIVAAYAESDSGNKLHARFSDDDGDTWSDPVLLDSLDQSMRITWITFVQPADDYDDNAARFFYGYAAESTPQAVEFENNVRWVSFTPPEPNAFAADFDNNGNVGGGDFLIWQASFGVDDGGDADFNGETDGEDFRIWQTEFGAGSGSAGAALPEPAAIALLSVSLFSSLSRARRQSSRGLPLLSPKIRSSSYLLCQ